VFTYKLVDIIVLSSSSYKYAIHMLTVNYASYVSLNVSYLDTCMNCFRLNTGLHVHNIIWLFLCFV